jgi:hypothetical protein
MFKYFAFQFGVFAKLYVHVIMFTKVGVEGKRILGNTWGVTTLPPQKNLTPKFESGFFRGEEKVTACFHSVGLLIKVL